MILLTAQDKGVLVDDRCAKCRNPGKCALTESGQIQKCPRTLNLVRIEGVLSRVGPCKNLTALEQMCASGMTAIREGGLHIKDRQGNVVGEMLRLWVKGDELLFAAMLQQGFDFDTGFSIEGKGYGRGP